MATTRKATAKRAATKTPAKKAAATTRTSPTTVKSTAPADLSRPAGSPAEGLEATPATAETTTRTPRTFDQVVARVASGTMGTGRGRDQAIRREGHDPQEVVRAAHKVRLAKNK
jgi:hypothetical protein